MILLSLESLIKQNEEGHLRFGIQGAYARNMNPTAADYSLFAEAVRLRVVAMCGVSGRARAQKL